MPTSDIEPFDLSRMFFGDMTWLFTLEIIFRTGVIYLYTVILVRWISKRAVGQLSLVEFLLVIALGSAVGDPMFYPDVPILHAMVVIAVVVCIDRGLLFVVNLSERTEQIVEGSPILLVNEGVIQLSQLREAMLSPEKLFEKLRTQQIEHLGQIQWAFLEQGGEITVFRKRPVTPGLQIVPPWDLDEPVRIQADTVIRNGTVVACIECGRILDIGDSIPLPDCPNCQGTQWTTAVEYSSRDDDDGA